MAAPLLASCTLNHEVWYDIPGTGRDDPATMFSDSTGRCTLGVVLQGDVPAAVLWINARDSIRFVDVSADLCPARGDSSATKCMQPIQVYVTTGVPGQGLQMAHADSFPALPAEYRVVRNAGKQGSAMRLEFYAHPEQPARGAAVKAPVRRGADVYTLRVRMVLESGGRPRTVERTFRLERKEDTHLHMDRIGGC